MHTCCSDEKENLQRFVLLRVNALQGTFMTTSFVFLLRAFQLFIPFCIDKYTLSCHLNTTDRLQAVPMCLLFFMLLPVSTLPLSISSHTFIKRQKVMMIMKSPLLRCCVSGSHLRSRSRAQCPCLKPFLKSMNMLNQQRGRLSQLKTLTQNHLNFGVQRRVVFQTLWKK